MLLVDCPDKLVAKKFNILAVNGGDFAAILWKDGEYFLVRQPDILKPILLSEQGAWATSMHNFFGSFEPIPLNNLAEWPQRVKHIDENLLSLMIRLNHIAEDEFLPLSVRKAAQRKLDLYERRRLKKEQPRPLGRR